MSTIKSILFALVQFVGGLFFFLFFAVIVNFVRNIFDPNSAIAMIPRIVIVLTGIGLAIYYFRRAMPGAGSGFVVGIIMYIAAVWRGDM